MHFEKYDLTFNLIAPIIILFLANMEKHRVVSIPDKDPPTVSTGTCDKSGCKN